MAFRVPNKFRVRKGFYGTDDGAGNNGVFLVKLKRGQHVKVIASDGEGWEHVSVSRDDRCPLWEEMCEIKKMFWDDPEDCVIQYHPPESDYVSTHQYCLHLWRPIGTSFPRPPAMMVGIKGVELI